MHVVGKWYHCEFSSYIVRVLRHNTDRCVGSHQGAGTMVSKILRRDREMSLIDVMHLAILQSACGVVCISSTSYICERIMTSEQSVGGTSILWFLS